MYRFTEPWDFLRNARVVRNATEYLTLPADFLRSSSDRLPEVSFDSVHTFVLFVGIGRSGTTLLGALLDAHPNAIVANQQCALKYLHPFPFARDRIFRLLLQNSMRAARDGRPGGGGYSYAVPGQWQGRFERIEVIGDKSRSAQSVEWLAARPDLLQQLAQTVRARIRMLHVIRNPCDTIARRSLRRRVSLQKISAEYFVLTRKLQNLFERLESQPWLDAERVPIYLEDLVSAPMQQLGELCDALGLRRSEDYLAACASILFDKPSEARNAVQWPAALLADIQRRIQDVPYLRRYSLESNGNEGRADH